MYLSAVLDSGSMADFVGAGKIAPLFRPHEQPFYDFIVDFVKKHAKLPAMTTVEAHIKDELTPAIEPASYYLELMQSRHVEQKLKESMKDATAALQPAVKDTDLALSKLIDTCMDLVSMKFSRQVIDFRECRDLVIGEYVKEYTMEDSDRLMMGWPYLDDLSGGLTIGDVLSVVGRPAMGKTWQTLFACLHGWKPHVAQMKVMDNKIGKKFMKDVIVNGQSRMFVSMEMSPTVIAQRLSSLHMHIPYGPLDKAALTSKHFNVLKKGLTEVSHYGEPLWIVDGNLTATVEDIWMLARQLKPHSIFIDGAYLLKHPTEKDRYKRVAENADLLKSDLAPLGPVVASWQFARPKNKGKKKGDKPDLEDIGYTDVIGQVSSLVLALLQSDSVETVMERVIDVLKGRKGEIGNFRTKWDFNSMDFSQVDEVAVEELVFE